ncbi:MAG: hypothetical protein LIO69_10070 [Oscillospiraceae bacterium]|nr:hypothetical protein [Oscillospiraceae bacterium]
MTIPTKFRIMAAVGAILLLLTACFGKIPDTSSEETEQSTLPQITVTLGESSNYTPVLGDSDNTDSLSSQSENPIPLMAQLAAGASEQDIAAIAAVDNAESFSDIPVISLTSDPVGKNCIVLALSDDTTVTVTDGEFDQQYKWVQGDLCEEITLDMGECFLLTLPSSGIEYMLTVTSDDRSTQFTADTDIDGIYYLYAPDYAENTSLIDKNSFAADIAAAAALNEYFSNGDEGLGSERYAWNTVGWYSAIRGLNGNKSTLSSEELTEIFSAVSYSEISDNSYMPPANIAVTYNDDEWDFFDYTQRLTDAMANDFSYMPADGTNSIIIYADIYKGGFTYSRSVYIVRFEHETEDISLPVRVTEVVSKPNGLSEVGSSAVYKNNLYGFTFDVPSGFTLTTSEKSGVSVLADEDNDITISLFCTETACTDAKDCLSSFIAEQTGITYTELLIDGYIAIYEENSRLYYRKSVVSEGRELTALYCYPAYGGEYYGSVIRGSENSLVFVGE